MLADQTKVSPWINADPSVGFSCLSLPTAAGGNRGDTGTRSETITFLAAEPRHFTRHGKPLLVWRSCSSYFCTNVHCTFTRAKLTLLQCVVCAHAREERVRARGVWVKAAGRGAEYSRDSGPGDQSYGLPRVLRPRPTLFCKTGFTRYNFAVLVLPCSLCWSLSLNSVATRERAYASAHGTPTRIDLYV